MKIVDGFWQSENNPTPRSIVELEVTGEYVKTPGNYVRRSDGFLDAAPAAYDGEFNENELPVYGEDIVAHVPGYGWLRVTRRGEAYYASVTNGRIVKMRRK